MNFPLLPLTQHGRRQRRRRLVWKFLQGYNFSSPYTLPLLFPCKRKGMSCCFPSSCSCVCNPDSKVCCHLCIVLYYGSHVFMLLSTPNTPFRTFSNGSYRAACVVDGRRKNFLWCLWGRFLSGGGNEIQFHPLPPVDG